MQVMHPPHRKCIQNTHGGYSEDTKIRAGDTAGRRAICHRRVDYALRSELRRCKRRDIASGSQGPGVPRSRRRESCRQHSAVPAGCPAVPCRRTLLGGRLLVAVTRAEVDGLADGVDGERRRGGCRGARATPGRCCQQASSAAPAALPDTGTSVRSRSRGSGRSRAGAPVSVIWASRANSAPQPTATSKLPALPRRRSASGASATPAALAASSAAPARPWPGRRLPFPSAAAAGAGPGCSPAPGPAACWEDSRYRFSPVMSGLTPARRDAG